MTGGFVRSVHSWPRALPYVRPHKPIAVGALFSTLVAAGVALAEPWPVAILVDSVLGEKDLPGKLGSLAGSSLGARITVTVALGVLVSLAIHGMAAVTQYLNTKLEQAMVLEFRSQIFQHVQGLSFSYHDERRTGEFMGRINQQANSVGKVVVNALPLLQSALTLIGMFVIAFRLDPAVAVLSLAVVPFIYYSTGFYGTRIGPEVRRVKIMEMRSLHIVHEAVQMLRVIVAFNREDEEYRRFREQGETAVDARVRLTLRQMLFSLGVNLITACGTAAVLWLGAWQVVNGRLTTGQLLVLVSYIASVYRPLEKISSTINGIQEQLISFELALELLEHPKEITERPEAVVLDRAGGRVAFESVSFAYKGRDRTLRDVSFEVSPGQAVAIVGPTGAGKSTLVSLIPRFYDPQEGRIRLEGHDIRDLTLASLRAQISIVLQEPLLFTGSIKENIRYGRLDADDDEVRAAARAANVDEFVKKLPQRYRTKLGERGAQLSGGERQRICVARAFLKDAPILILDEPTSSIDSGTEASILDALARLMVGRTTFLIAHRLSTVRAADLVLVVNDGRIVQAGNHDELAGVDGVYRNLWAAQSGRPSAVPAAEVSA